MCIRDSSSTELVEFRKRIGIEGVELILKESIRINGKDGDEETLSAVSYTHLDVYKRQWCVFV